MKHGNIKEARPPLIWGMKRDHESDEVTCSAVWPGKAFEWRMDPSSSEKVAWDQMINNIDGLAWIL